MFHKTSVRLALVYLAIMAAISLFFSANLYHITVQEFNRDYWRQVDYVRRVPGFAPSHSDREQFLTDRYEELRDAKARLLGRLIVANVVILAGSGILSYYLARRTLRPMEEAHEAQMRFTADASHELRTPLTAMQTEIEVALMNPKLSLVGAKKQLNSNLEELARMTALSEGLLRLASLQGNDLPEEPVSIEGIIFTAVQRATPLAEKKQQLIKTTIPKGLSVMGDETSLVEVLTILLDNAIKYSANKTEIRVTATKSQRNVHIAIADSGPGIKPEALPHIFDRFYRGDTSRSKDKASGYGLGLSIAKNIVNLHGGSITVASKIDKGSTFTVKLPLS